ncbi:MAG: signal peptidase II [Rhodospirillales bacterium]|nr:signal peptidase II [Rhodospirillales bacterium]
MARLGALGFGLVLAALAVVIDQTSKWWILALVMDPPRVIPVASFFNLVLTWNKGISFGLFNNDNSLNALILSALALAIVVVLVLWLRRAENALIAAGLGLIIGGALGNVIDRTLHGAVVDFLDFSIAGYHWPAFNAADSFISIGAVILIYDSLFSGRPRRNRMNNT